MGISGSFLSFCRALPSCTRFDSVRPAGDLHISCLLLEAFETLGGIVGVSVLTIHAVLLAGGPSHMVERSIFGTCVLNNPYCPTCKSPSKRSREHLCHMCAQRSKLSLSKPLQSTRMYRGSKGLHRHSFDHLAHSNRLENSVLQVSLFLGPRPFTCFGPVSHAPSPTWFPYEHISLFVVPLLLESY